MSGSTRAPNPARFGRMHIYEGRDGAGRRGRSKFRSVGPGDRGQIYAVTAALFLDLRGVGLGS